MMTTNHEASHSTTEAPEWPEIGALIDHILARHHEPLRPELARLEALAVKVAEVHGAERSEPLAELSALVGLIRADVEPHMMKEERVLFPWIRGPRAREATAPIAVMRADHEVLDGLLIELAELTDGFAPPADACSSWRALYAGLAALDSDLRTHMHLENDVLFPWALEGRR